MGNLASKLEAELNNLAAEENRREQEQNMEQILHEKTQIESTSTWVLVHDDLTAYSDDDLEIIDDYSASSAIGQDVRIAVPKAGTATSDKAETKIADKSPSAKRGVVFRIFIFNYEWVLEYKVNQPTLKSVLKSVNALSASTPGSAETCGPNDTNGNAEVCQQGANSNKPVEDGSSATIAAVQDILGTARPFDVEWVGGVTAEIKGPEIIWEKGEALLNYAKRGALGYKGWDYVCVDAGTTSATAVNSTSITSENDVSTTSEATQSLSCSPGQNDTNSSASTVPLAKNQIECEINLLRNKGMRVCAACESVGGATAGDAEPVGSAETVAGMPAVETATAEDASAAAKKTPQILLKTCGPLGEKQECGPLAEKGNAMRSVTHCYVDCRWVFSAPVVKSLTFYNGAELVRTVQAT